MNSIKFYDGTALEAEHLNKATDCIHDGMRATFLDNYTFGVVIDKSPETIVYTDGSSLGIYGITAYDEYGNRIHIDTVDDDVYGNKQPAISGLKPDDNGLLIRGGHDLTRQYTYTLVIRYKENLGEPITHHVEDGTPYLMGVIGGYELYLRDSGETIAGDITLADIAVDSFGNITIDESVRETSHVQESTVVATINVPENSATSSTTGGTTQNPWYGTNVSFADHINSIGSGAVTQKNPHGLAPEDIGIDVAATANHQKLLHVDGIRSDNIASTGSAMYPSYRRESASNYETVYIQPLSAALNEMAVIDGESVYPADFSATYSYSFEQRASSANLGYYIFVYNGRTKAIEMSGPFPSETDAGFVQLLNTSYLFPICSLQWGYVSYDVTGDNIADAYSYDIIPSTFKDRRVFNNTSLKNFRPDDAFALTQFAPVANDTAYIHNARIMSSTTFTKYDVAGKTLTLIIDDDPANAVTVTFTGTEGVPMPVSDIISQLTTALIATNDAGTTYLRAYPRIVASDYNSTDAGKISISAPYSIAVETASSAAATLGFSPDTNNTSDTSVGLVREMLYYGERNGIIVFTYDSNDLVTQIDYFLGGGLVRRNKFTYMNGYITRVEEIIEAL